MVEIWLQEYNKTDHDWLEENKRVWMHAVSFCKGRSRLEDKNNCSVPLFTNLHDIC